MRSGADKVRRKVSVFLGLCVGLRAVNVVCNTQSVESIPIGCRNAQHRVPPAAEAAQSEERVLTIQDFPTADWPGGKAPAVSLTFDVDAEAGWLGEGDEYARRLTILSEGRYGVTRGVPRILDLLARQNIPGTFF